MRWRARDAPVDREIRGIAPLTQVPIQQIRCARQMVDLKTEKAERDGRSALAGTGRTYRSRDSRHRTADAGAHPADTLRASDGRSENGKG